MTEAELIERLRLAILGLRATTHSDDRARDKWGWFSTTPSGAAWVGFDFGLAVVAVQPLGVFGPRWRVVFRNGIVLEVYT